MATRQTANGLHRANAGGDRFVNSHAFEWLARAGFVARGLVYGIIGVLAVKLAVGHGGAVTNQRGALETVAAQPFGHWLLILVAIGLGGYSMWRLFRALLGHGPDSSDTGFARLAAAASGLAYGAMCVLAIEIVSGAQSASSGKSTSPKHAAAGVLGWPGGQWIVGLAGLVMVGVALYQGYRGLTKAFLKDSKTEEMSHRTKEWIARIGMVGHLARMVVFGLVGIFLIKAALDFKARDAVGLDGALAKLLHHSYGTLALGVVAAGLVAFALYSLSDARYRRI